MRRRRDCSPAQPSIVLPPPAIIALASATAFSVSSPGDPAFVPLTSFVFGLDEDSVGFTQKNGVLTLQGTVPRLVDVRGHVTLTAPDAGTDVQLGVVLDGIEFIARGRGLIILPEGGVQQVQADALVLMNPGQTLSLGVLTGGAVDLDANLASIVAKSP